MARHARCAGCDRSTSTAPQPLSYFEFCTSGMWGHAARIGDYKAVAISSDAPLELYQVTVDAGETKNLAEERPDLLGPLAACLEAQHTDSPEFPRGDASCESSETRA